MIDKRATKVVVADTHIWTLWFIGGFTLVVIGMEVIPAFVSRIEIPDTSALEAIYQSSKVFMLVVGIMAIYTFLNLFIEFGKTRQDYIHALTISGLLLAVTLSVGALLVSALLTPIFDQPTQAVINETAVHYLSIDAALIMVSTYVFYFALGMFITSIFYRFGWIIGILGVGVAIFITIIESYLFGTESIFSGLHSLGDGVNLYLAALLTLVASGLIFMLLKKLLARVQISVS
ncbi:hypothetical protein FLK61_26945 [Paenalkalicoccus suaedae]|uniref:DUF4052 domain-containing protein n=1 Tax=Paenalkalicoccus suaedae TaxID=2592382 RepID=A0A859FCT8_9BACI|nr:hypothetical protein [Paenalkalicoccus suaedae]QKS70394.1 hypothetical protein FLK61_26945 [Paenalkalicoccus suaedae]